MGRWPNKCSQIQTSRLFKIQIDPMFFLVKYYLSLVNNKNTSKQHPRMTKDGEQQKDENDDNEWPNNNKQ